MVCCKPKEITPSLKIPSYERSVNGKLFTILTQTINVLWCTCNYFYEVMHLVKCIFLKRVKESCCCWLLARRKIVNVLYLTLVMHVIIFIPFCLESSNQCQSGIIEYCHYYRAWHVKWGNYALSFYDIVYSLNIFNHSHQIPFSFCLIFWV